MPAMTSAAIATIIGAILAAAGTVASGVISSNDAEDARNEGRRLSERQRQDNERWNAASDRLSRARLGHEKNILRFQKKEAGLGRKERALERGMAARENTFQRPLQLVNQQEALKSNFLNIFQRRAA